MHGHVTSALSPGSHATDDRSEETPTKLGTSGTCGQNKIQKSIHEIPLPPLSYK